MGNIKIGNRDITGIFIGNKYISKVQLGSDVIWEYLTGSLDNGNITYEYVDGTLTFSGTGTIPVITNSGDTNDLYQKASSTKKIIVNDSIVEITKGAFGAFENLQEITLPFVGKNAKSEYFVYPFGYIFGQSGSSSSSYYLVESYIKNGSESYQCYLPQSLVEVILTGGQYNKTYLYENSFRNCTYIQKLVIPNNIINIENGALYKCKINSLTIPFIGDNGLYFNNYSHSFSSQTFGGIFGKYKNQESPIPQGYKSVETFTYQGLGVDNYWPVSAGSACLYGLIPEALKYITITGYDVPWYAFYYISNLINLKAIKFTSTNLNYPTKRICDSAFYGLGVNEECKIYLPQSIEKIGSNPNSGTNNNSKIYFQGNSSKWDNLKTLYIKDYGTGEFFNNWKVEYNSKPEDIQEVTTIL